MDRSCVRRDFLTVDRTPEMGRAICTAMEEGHAEIHSQRNGREYQFDLSRIESEGTVVGAVLISGVRSFLYEMTYNLCDNAVKYNVEGGRVEIAVLNGDDGPVVSVKDTE